MKVRKSGAKYSAIVGISEQLKQKSAAEKQEYLYLNRGINAVVNIDLSEVIPLIDFNSNDIQVYPPNSGRKELKAAINQHYFHGQTSDNHIFITNGGMNALDLTIKTLDVDKILVPKLYWGAYLNIMKVNRRKYGWYEDFDWLSKNVESLKGSAIIICDPNNPVGDKYDDQKLLDLVQLLNDNEVIIIWDSPYRMLFFDETDRLYTDLLAFDNVILIESFSKSIGLSGQRLGFIHSNHANFGDELNINILYVTNGINAFAQVLVEKILTSPEGQSAAREFKKATTNGIRKNIVYLQNKGLLAKRFYEHSAPMGIFVIIEKTFDELLDKQIGSVALPYFTQLPKEEAEKYVRICVSVPHGKFKTYFDRLRS